jgi:hypothetical protein
VLKNVKIVLRSYNQAEREGEKKKERKDITEKEKKSYFIFVGDREKKRKIKKDPT